MPRISAGLLMYRVRDNSSEVFLVHPGGPFFKHKDDGYWTIPKGEPEPDEDLLTAALREFAEETGITPAGPFMPLAAVMQKGGKTVHAWACEGDIDLGVVVSNTFSMEWPPRSGRQATFPEIDRADYFDLKTAKRKINPAQAGFLDELEAGLGGRM